MRPSPRYDHVYAILRYETTAGPDVPIEVRITVKKIVMDPQVAKEEVERLNLLKRDKGCYYFSQVTRIEKGLLAASAPQEEEVGKPPDR